MSQVTALQMVNRMLVRMRFPTVTDLSSTRALHVLDVVNRGMLEVLEERTWQWQIRSDGVLFTVPRLTGTAAFFSLYPDPTGGTVADWGAANAAYAFGDFVSRLALESDLSFGQTSLRIRSAVVGGAANIQIYAEAWKGSNFTVGAASTWTAFAYEYLLPAAVRQLLSVRHQERELELLPQTQIDYESSYPRPWSQASDASERVIAMGLGIPTVLTGSATPEPSTMIAIWPVPESVLRLDYSYVSRQTRLVAPTDLLVGVPDVVSELILDFAYAYAAQGMILQDPATGFTLETRARERMRRLFGAHPVDARQHHPVVSWDRASPRSHPLHGLDLPIREP